MRILGIDPGLRHTGWGVIDMQGQRYKGIACGAIHPPTDTPLSQRLGYLSTHINTVLTDFQPQSVAIEETFVNTNPRQALVLGQARGAIIAQFGMHHLPVGEYAPNKIKKTVVGAGHADKKQIQMMLGILLPGLKIDSADAADALAIAICHAHHLPAQQLASA